MARVADGNSEAFAAIYERYAARALRLDTAICGRAASEDVIQEVAIEMTTVDNPGDDVRNGSRRVAPSTVTDEQRAAEAELFRRYAIRKDRSIREDIIERFMPLARALALRYQAGREPLDDLIQVANLGLVKAVNGFDPARGKPFTAYAVPTILGELRRHFRDHVWNLRLPRGLQESTMKVDQAVDRLTEKLGRSPTPKQVAAELGITEEDVLEALQAADARRTSSLDTAGMGDEEGARPVIETIGCEESGYDRVEAEIASATAGLDEREQRVLEMRFYKGMTQHEVGVELGVSQMQISRVSRKALRKLLVAVQGGEVRDA